MAKLFRSKSKSKENSPHSSRGQSPQRFEEEIMVDLHNQFNENYDTHEQEQGHANNNGKNKRKNDYDSASLFTQESHEILSSNPLAAAMGQVLAALNQLTHDGKLKDTEFFNIGKFASDMEKCHISEEKNKQAFQLNVNKCMQDEVSTFKKTQREQELNFHCLNPMIKCPTLFSNQETLTTHEKKSNLYKILPFGRNKFSGKNDNIKISEFLLNLNFIQERFNLSLTEFKNALQFSMTGSAFEVISHALEAGEPLSSIYNRLLVMYEKTKTPFDAKRELMNYTASKNQNIMDLTTEIQKLSTISSKLTQDVFVRKTNCDAEACSTFIHCLPTESKTLAITQFNLLSNKDGKPPSFIDFILYLQPYQTTIESDIKRNGENKNRISNKPEKNHSYAKSIYNLDRNNYNKYNGNSRNKSIYNLDKYSYNKNNGNSRNYQPRNPNIRDMQGSRKNNFLNRKFCNLCGLKNHSAVDGCYRMKNASGKTVSVSPVQQACRICEKHHNIRLFHPEKFCFNKQKSNSTRNS